MSDFNQWVVPLNRTISEKTPRGATIEWEDFPTTIDVTGPLLYTLMPILLHQR
ncbi:MAG: (2Fe-2S) ferredoxin domain-containing protein, partial [Okeania sp. SIO2H7]|nr:(2Fe-2S) ferredoxin domain-containing protein [Okeania sp. SIO2H7]